MESDLLSPRGIVARAKAEGLSAISETTVRRWLKTGEVHAVYSGNRALIYWPAVYEYVTGTRYSGRADTAVNLSA